MKLKYMDPEQIMTIITSLIILAVGIFAFFVTVSNIPTTAAVDNRVLGITADGAIADTNTTDYLTVPSNVLNDTTPCILSIYNTSAATWAVLQAAGACNGTFMSNDTYRIAAGTSHWWNKSGNSTWRLSFTTIVTPTTTLQNSTYQAVINASNTGNSVFNIIGIVLIIGAIMAIVGLVYSYMKPKY